MAAKRRIIYESEDEDDHGDHGENQAKKSRTQVIDKPATPQTGTRRSERSGKGNGGRLAQMKQIEQVQTESTRRPSKIDIVTQGEDINPMAPSFREPSERSRRSGSDEPVTSQTYRSTQSYSQSRPEFLQAAPGQQFGFRLPDVGSQTPHDTQAPSRIRFSGVSSQTSATSSASNPPSSRSASLFSSDTSGTTPATSRASSVCLQTGERRLADQRGSLSGASRASNADHPPHAAPARNPVTLQRTASFYNIPFDTSRAAHSLFAAPEDDLYDTGTPTIDENSPSDDERIAEDALHRGEGSNGPLAHSNETSVGPSPSLERPGRSSPSPLDNDEEIGREQHDDQVPVRTHSQSRDETAATYRRRHHSPDNVDGTDTGGAMRSQHQIPPSQQSLSAQAPENVVSTYRRRNRAPRLPSNSQLLAARRQQGGPVPDHLTGQAVNTSNGQDTVPVGPASERSEPWQLQFYDPSTRDVIERAKQFSHCDAASINPFPVRAAFNAKAVEYIDEAIAERRERGLVIPDGWWPRQSSNIARLLWEDLGNWRSTLRKKARVFVTQRYRWDPENRRERNIDIAKNLLGGGGLFLRDGTDNEGHVNNLAHPALSGLVIDFFYTSPVSVGKLFPEVFDPM